jgi:hypothetical protein
MVEIKEFKNVYVSKNLLFNVNIENHSTIITMAWFKKRVIIKNSFRTVLLFGCPSV